VVDERRDVLRPGPQRRERDGDHVEAVEEVLAEALRRHALAQVAVRRGDHPHVHLALAHVADRAHHAALQHVEQLGLQGRRHLADLVEEE